jgi:indole-3-glycerol phosphate synthase
MLTDIVNATRAKLIERKKNVSLSTLVKSTQFNAPCYSLSEFITNENLSGIIAEFKRKSPSKGIINDKADVIETTSGYVASGASALSVLTEEDYFMGKNEDLILARSVNQIPILRKDFIVDEYQIIEAKSIGADAILLIAACLDRTELKSYFELAKSLGMEVLFEVHAQEELQKLPDNAVIIGVNNRNLKTMEVSLQTSIDLAKELSSSFVLVSESGLNSVDDVLKLKDLGYSGFLMGEHFMRTQNPPLALQQFMDHLKAVKS